MKRLLVLACMIAIAYSASSMNKGPRRSVQHNCIHVISMDNDIFYFKSDREVAGAVVDVYDYKSGVKVMSHVISGKKTIVDLYAQVPGDYIILITKGDFNRKYVFHKK